MVQVHLLCRNLLVTASLLTLAGTAYADSDHVVGRITDHSNLSSSTAKKLVSKVNVRMAKAADATANANDPMRAAVSLALFQAPQPPNSMAAAKVRLRLYAGLNEWALEAIFSPQAGVVAGCVREVGATTSECEALVAAAAKSSVAQIRNVAGGSAASAAPAFANQAPSGGSSFGGGAPAANGGSRFGRFNSGFSGAAPQQQQRYAPPQQQYQQAPRYGGYQQPPQQGYQAAPRYPQQQQYQAAPRYPQQPQQQYGAQQQGYSRPAAPPQPQVSPSEAAARRDAYKAQREAYLARQKAQFQDRRNKQSAVHAADAAEAPPRAGEGADPLTPVNAAASASAPSAPAKSASKAAPAPAAEGGDDEPSEPVASKAASKPALDNDFLDGLLDDPLAKGKKK